MPAAPKASSPSVPRTSFPPAPGQVNGVHDKPVEVVAAQPPAPAAQPPAPVEPNGFDEFDPRGSVPGIVCTLLAVNLLMTKPKLWKIAMFFCSISL